MGHNDPSQGPGEIERRACVAVLKVPVVLPGPLVAPRKVAHPVSNLQVQQRQSLAYHSRHQPMTAERGQLAKFEHHPMTAERGNLSKERGHLPKKFDPLRLL